MWPFNIIPDSRIGGIYGELSHHQVVLSYSSCSARYVLLHVFYLAILNLDVGY